MSRSSFHYKGYSVIASTSAVMVDCGLIAKTIEQDCDLRTKNEFAQLVNDLKDKATTYYGFVILYLDNYLTGKEEKFISIIDKTVSYLNSFGKSIPLEVVKEIQEKGYLEKDSDFKNEMPTEYISDFLLQVKQMILDPIKGIDNQGKWNRHFFIYRADFD